jgi:formylglycine-generating enzyme required for sulfatase activity
MLDNIHEWCNDLSHHNLSKSADKPKVRPEPDDEPEDDEVTSEVVQADANRDFRGGSFYDQPARVRSASVLWDKPFYRNFNQYGFPIAKTIPKARH